MAAEAWDVEVSGRKIRITNPDKIWFATRGETKRDCIEYYLAVGDGALRAVRDRPTVLRRFPDGADSEGFYQKRVPKHAPDWLHTVRIRFPSGRAADELCPADLAHVVWAVQSGSFGLHPWPVRAGDVDHPDLVRIDLDPQEDLGFASVRAVAPVVAQILAETGLHGFPKTSGGRGLHVLVPIEPEWGFVTVRRAVLALAREVERRIPDLATSKWWKEERGRRVFVDYNQAARDRTIIATYAVRPRPDATVSAPVSWDEVAECEPEDFTLATMPARYAALGDLHAGIDDVEVTGRLDALLEMAERDEAEGLGDAPWPPNFPKGDSEPLRAPPSIARQLKEARDHAGIGSDGPPPRSRRRPAVVFDIDGTLASTQWRMHFIQSQPKNWDAFFEGIPRDSVNPEAALMYANVADGVDRVLVSGRPEHTRAATEAWLARHGLDAGPLFMRPDGDRRPDHIVKRDLYEMLVEPYWDVQLAVEDLPHMLSMWSSFHVAVARVDDPGLDPQDA